MPQPNPAETLRWRERRFTFGGVETRTGVSGGRKLHSFDGSTRLAQGAVTCYRTLVSGLFLRRRAICRSLSPAGGNRRFHNAKIEDWSRLNPPESKGLSASTDALP
jgi:hypothetical protein